MNEEIKEIEHESVPESETEKKNSETKLSELKEKLSSLEKEKESLVKKTSTLADTVILTDEDIKYFLNMFEQKLDFNLLYRSSRDGKEYTNYKTKIGSHKNLLIVGKTDTDIKLGGYTINNLLLISDFINESDVKESI